uniref:Uncharacterized protein n=1 Tax=Acrobeloides nanus TaxID=290746 RepID=A0A914E9X5_9BILA
MFPLSCSDPDPNLSQERGPGPSTGSDSGPDPCTDHSPTLVLSYQIWFDTIHPDPPQSDKIRSFYLNMSSKKISYIPSRSAWAIYKS